MNDLAASPWNTPSTVAGFATASPNLTLRDYAAARLGRTHSAAPQAAGFTPDPTLPLHELNRPGPGLRTTGAPVIYEGAFRFS